VKRFWRDSFILKIKLYAINHPVFQDDNGQTSLTLDLDALRSFVTGIECGSFALAASRLCRSTSAVSAQLKKLEQQCDAELVVKQGRHLALTRNGEILMGYARRLLALNDEAQRALKGELLQGEIRIGMQEDFGESLMPGILGEFSATIRGCGSSPGWIATRRCSRRSMTTRWIWHFCGSRKTPARRQTRPVSA
jgi:hypothetical protein